MVLTKKKGDNSTLRKIWNDDRSECIGVVGTFTDLLTAGIVERVTEYSLDTWCCLPLRKNPEQWGGIGATREQAIKNTIFGKK